MGMNNSRHMDTGEEPPVMDWRTQLQPDFRPRIVINMLNSLKKYIKISARKVLIPLEKHVDRIEEEAYNKARSEWSYLLEISHKMLLTEAGLLKLPNYVVNGNRPLDEDWRTQLQPYFWKQINSKMMDTCRKFLPLSCELDNIFKEYEENLYLSAASQWDYVWQLSQMMSNIETKFQNIMPNQVGNSNRPSDQESVVMQPQVHNQAQSLGMTLPHNQTQTGQQLPQNIQNLTPNVVGQDPSMQAILDSSQNSFDWRRPSCRQNIYDMMMDICKKHISFSGPDGLYYLKYFVNDFEDKVYKHARNQWHYLCYVTQTMDQIESNRPNIIQRSMLNVVGLNASMQCVPSISENSVGNPMDLDVPMDLESQQQPRGSTTLDSTAQTVDANGVYLQEVEYQKIKLTEDELGEMEQEILTKLQQLCVADGFDGMSYD